MRGTNRYNTNGYITFQIVFIPLDSAKHSFLPLPITGHQVLSLNERFWCIYEQPVVNNVEVVVACNI